MNDSKEDDTADIDSDTSIGTDVPDGAEDGDGTDSTDDNFDDHIHDVNIRMFTQPTGPRHNPCSSMPQKWHTSSCTLQLT